MSPPCASPQLELLSESSVSSIEENEVLYQQKGQISGHKVISQSQETSHILPISSLSNQKLQTPQPDPSLNSPRSRRWSFNPRNIIKLERKTTRSSLETKDPLPISSASIHLPTITCVDKDLSHSISSNKLNNEGEIEDKSHLAHLTSQEIEPCEANPTEFIAKKIALSMQSFVQDNFSFVLERGDEAELSTFIYKHIQNFPAVYHTVLKIMLSYIQNASSREMPLLTQVTEKILKSMENQYLLIEHSIIEQIGQTNDSLSTLISPILHNAYAFELIQFQLPQNTERPYEACLLCHTWFIPTSYFLLFLCERAIDSAMTLKESLRLLQIIHNLISHPLVYPLTYSNLFRAYRYFSKIPDIAALAEVKKDLLETTKPLIKVSSPAIIKVVSPVRSMDVSKPFQSEPIPPHIKESALQIKDISIAIMHAKLTSTMVHTFAWDLKKLEAFLFTQITASEFSEFKKNQNKAEVALHLKAYIQHTNLLISFIVSHILSFSKPKERAQCCMFYIQLMTRSIKMGNLNSAITIFGALNHSSILRLKQTWALINKKNLLRLEKADELFAFNNNYANYNQHLKKWEKEHSKMDARYCLVPIFSQFLTHFTFIDDGNSTLLEDGRLNYDKVQLLAQEHAAIFSYQTGLHSFESELLNKEYSYDIEFHLEAEGKKALLKGLNQVFIEAYKLSCQLEPPSIPTKP